MLGKYSLTQSLLLALHIACNKSTESYNEMLGVPFFHTASLQVTKSGRDRLGMRDWE